MKMPHLCAFCTACSTSKCAGSSYTETTTLTVHVSAMMYIGRNNACITCVLGVSQPIPYLSRPAGTSYSESATLYVPMPNLCTHVRAHVCMNEPAPYLIRNTMHSCSFPLLHHNMGLI